MPILVGVTVRRTKDKIYADSGDLDLKLNDRVILETENGRETGIVCETEKFYEKGDKNLTAVGKIVHLFSSTDETRLKENEIKARESLQTIIQKIDDYELEMKLTAVDYTFDRTKLFIYYTAEERVDFRELIKDLGHLLKTRIQMVQIGARDAARMLGGIGPCGELCCCRRFLKEFQSINVDLAKEQNLSLNIAKLTGLCGKLLCCLAYESEFYKEASKKFPPLESLIKTSEGEAKVREVNYLTEMVTLEYTDGKTKRVKIEELGN